MRTAAGTLLMLLAQTADAACEPLLLDVHLNGQALSGVYALSRDPQTQELYADPELVQALRAERLQLGLAVSGGACGEEAARLAQWPALNARLDERALRLDLQAPAELFSATRLGSELPPVVVSPSPPGGYFNYQLSAQNVDRLRYAGLFELGAFNAQGSGLAAFSLYHYEQLPSFVLRELSWRHDDVPARQTWAIGDFIARPGSAFRRGGFLTGLQWSSNYALQPGYSTLPPLLIRGAATLPGAVDLLRGGQSQFAGHVPSGPFELEVPPSLNGAGQITAQLTDAQGSRQLVNLPVYVEPRLLREGLSEFAYELGVQRQNLGLRSFDYGPLVAGLSHRYGFSHELTAGIEAEVQSQLQTLGAEATYVIPVLGALEASGAFSNSRAGRGAQAALGLRRVQAAWSLVLRAEAATADFRSLGLIDSPARRGTRASASRSLGAYGALNLALLEDQYFDRPRERFALANYSLSPLPSLSLSLQYFHRAERREDRVSLNLSYAFGGRHAAYARSEWLEGQAQRSTVAYSRAARGRGDFGVQLSESYLHPQRRAALLAHIDYGSERGDCAMDLAQQGDDFPLRLACQGGFGLLDGELFAANTLTDSFAVVKIRNGAGVRVSQDGRGLGRADERGVLVAPQLPAYFPARLQLDEADIPLGAQANALELSLTPAYRSGVLARFAISRPRQATARLRDARGAPLAEGTRVARADGRVLFSGADGEVFLENLPARLRLSAPTAQGGCEYELVYPVSADPLPDLGVLPCQPEP